MPLATHTTPCLELADIVKTYPNGTRALSGVSITVKPGSIHALVGGNGAGKSTLIKVLAGAIPADSGRVLWQGEDVQWTSPKDPTRAGLATIHQTVPLIPALSVLENVVLSSTGWRRVPSDARRDFANLLDRMDYRIDPEAKVGQLSIGQRQMVAILQALATGAQAIVMDEPTASLALHERDVVFRTVRRLASTGTAFIYVSHFLDEVLDLSDEITLIRDGRVVDSGPTSEFTEERLAEGIAGQKLAQAERALAATDLHSREVLLSTRGLSSTSGIADIDLDVRRGEILGIAGLLGSGRSEVLHAIFGSDKAATGTVTVNGSAIRRSISSAMHAGIALVPEERLRQGLVADKEIWRNMTLASLPTVSWAGIIPDTALERRKSVQAVADLQIKTDSVDRLVSELSGGNAQKVLFAKWLLADADVFLLDEPFHGVDVGAKAEIVELIKRLAESGKAIVVVDSELRELLAMATRVVVLRRGRIVAERDAENTTDHELLLLASGITSGEEHVR